jgi:hypothetical protein
MPTGVTHILFFCSLLKYKTQSRDSIGSHTNNRHHQYTYITRQTPPKLHNSQRNWEAFRNEIEENLRLNIPLKTAKDIEEAIAEFTKGIQKAAWTETPDDKPQTKYPEYPWKVNLEEDGKPTS